MAEDTDGGRLAPFEDVERWAAQARALDAVDARVRERWLRRQDEEGATFAAVLLALAERGEAVVVTTTTAERHVGPVEAVGADFVALRTSSGRTTVVALESVAAVQGAAGDRKGPRPGPAAGDGGARAVTVTLAEVLAHAVGHRPRVRLRSGGAVVVGELRSVGTDVVTVVADGDAGAVVYLKLPSVSEASFLDSG